MTPDPDATTEPDVSAVEPTDQLDDEHLGDVAGGASRPPHITPY